MRLKVDVEFKTAVPLTQEQGLEFWSRARYFSALPGNGGRTYRWVAVLPGGTAFGAALSQIEAEIEQIVAWLPDPEFPGLRTNAARIISAELKEEADRAQP